MKTSLENIFNESINVEKVGKGIKITFTKSDKIYKCNPNGEVKKLMKSTNVYAKLDDNDILYLRATKKDGYKDYLNSSSIKSNWNTAGNANREKIKKVIIEEPIAPDTVCSMFYDCWSLKEIEMIENLHVENTTSFNSMFQGCTSLENINLNKFDTCNVTDMCRMFSGCQKLKELNLEEIETSNVNNMNSMFRGCGKLTKLDLNSFDTSNVTDMTSMFHDCVSIVELNLSSFNTGKVTIMKDMFNCCWKLKSVDMKSFNINNVTEISNMFYSVPNTIVIKATPATKTRIIGEYPDLENNFE